MNLMMRAGGKIRGLTLDCHFEVIIYGWVNLSEVLLKTEIHRKISLNWKNEK